jgi:hypothetical protein
MTQVEQEFRKTVIAFVGIGMHGLLERAVDPLRYVAVAM